MKTNRFKQKNSAEELFPPNNDRLLRILRTVYKTLDTPALIAYLADDRVRLLTCKSLTSPISNTDHELARRADAMMRSQGMEPEGVKKRLESAAYALGLVSACNVQLDYYDILGVDPFAKDSELRAAYRKKAFEMHPDTAGGPDQGTGDFATLHTAYRTLTDPDSRTAYDQCRQRLGDWHESLSEFDPAGPIPKRSGKLRKTVYRIGTVVVLMIAIAWVLTLFAEHNAMLELAKETSSPPKLETDKKPAIELTNETTKSSEPPKQPVVLAKAAQPAFKLQPKPINAPKPKEPQKPKTDPVRLQAPVKQPKSPDIPEGAVPFKDRPSQKTPEKNPPSPEPPAEKTVKSPEPPKQPAVVAKAAQPAFKLQPKPINAPKSKEPQKPRTDPVRPQAPVKQPKSPDIPEGAVPFKDRPSQKAPEKNPPSPEPPAEKTVLAQISPAGPESGTVSEPEEPEEPDIEPALPETPVDQPDPPEIPQGVPPYEESLPKKIPPEKKQVLAKADPLVLKTDKPIEANPSEQPPAAAPKRQMVQKQPVPPETKGRATAALRDIARSESAGTGIMDKKKPLPVTPAAKPDLPTQTAAAPKEKASPRYPFPDKRHADVRGHKQIETSQIHEFLERYTAAYERGDAQTFFAFFAPNATENGKPVKNLKPDYRALWEKIQNMEYLISVKTMDQKPESDSIHVDGHFNLAWKFHDGKAGQSHGTISLDLKRDNSNFHVKKLAYNFD